LIESFQIQIISLSKVEELAAVKPINKECEIEVKECLIYDLLQSEGGDRRNSEIYNKTIKC